MPVSLAGVSAVGAGVLLIYSGIKDKGVLTTVQDVVKGNAPAPIPKNMLANRTPGVPPSQGGEGNPNSQTAQDNQTYAHGLMHRYGWDSVEEWADLVNLWNKESGWSQFADTRKTGAGGDNASSTVFAYGIAQARPATKYPLAGRPSDLGGSSDPHVQIVWGMNYIKSRYGNPIVAWQHELANDWY